MARDGAPASVVLREITEVIEYLSAAYAAIGLYGSDHPLVSALAEAVADSTRYLAERSSAREASVDIACGAFLWQGAPIPPTLVSQLAADLYGLEAAAMKVAGAVEASSARALLAAIHRARHGGGSLDEAFRVFGSARGGSITLVASPAAGESPRSTLIGRDPAAGHRIAPGAGLQAALGDPAGDPGATADRIVDRLRAGCEGDSEIVRTWLIDQSIAAERAEERVRAGRKPWLAACVQRLPLEVREALLRPMARPDSEGLLAVARLAPVWPIDELIAALEGVAGNAALLRGTGRLLFTRLVELAKDDGRHRRVRAIIEAWGATPADSRLVAADPSRSRDGFSAEEYVEELLSSVRSDSHTGSAASFGEVESDDRVAVRAAEIGAWLSEETGDPDIAATGVARAADALIRQSRTDLVLRAVTREFEPGGDARQLSRGQRRLAAALKRPECVRSLLRLFDDPSIDAGLLRLLDLAQEHAATLLLEFCSRAPGEESTARALAWFRSLPAELRASAIGEHLSVAPRDADMLGPLCQGLEAFQIGHCVEHLLSPTQPEHTRAVLRLLECCAGSWPASVVQHVINAPRLDILEEAIASMTSGPAHTRSATIARVLCAMVSLRGVSTAELRALTDALRHDQPVAERAFVELLDVMRDRPSAIVRGDAEPLLSALRGYASVTEPTRRVLREWRSPRLRMLAVLGRMSGRHGARRRCA